MVFNIFEKSINKIVQLDLIYFQPVSDNCLAIGLRAFCAVISLALRVNVFIIVENKKLGPAEQILKWGANANALA